MSAIFQVPSLAKWLRKQPRGGTYEYVNHRECLIGQYFTAMGIPFRFIGASSWIDVNGKFHYLSLRFQDIAIEHPRTFGGALKRAQKYLRAA